MKVNKAIFILFFILTIISLTSVSAGDLSDNITDDFTDIGEGYLGSVDNVNEIYVDIQGKSTNNGSIDAPIDTIGDAISKSKENGTIYIADGEYKGSSNTKLTIDKSLTFIGSEDTVINGEKINYIFTVADGKSVTFKNIKFINSYKSPESYSVSYNSKVYGASLDIKNATVLVDNCSFINNVLSYGTRDNYIYGGAISNFGDLTVINSNFVNNTALSTSGLYSYGGSIYNHGKLSINNSSFRESKSVDFGYGGAIANDGELIMQNSIISNSTALHECKGAAIYNTKDFTLINSIVEDNYIERANFNFIYGVVYNSGTLTARGSIFRNNRGYYDLMPLYKGSPNIYNIGNLNITYCAFIDNNEYDGIASDIYINGGEVVDIGNNWWNTNENPYLTGLKINVDKVNTWLMFKLTPEYSKLNVSDSLTLKASWTNNIDMLSDVSSMPIFDVTFKADGISEIKPLINGSCDFKYDHTQVKGSYDVVASVGSFNQTAIVDVGKIMSYISFRLNENITYLDDLVVDVEVTGKDGGIPTGKVLLKINDATYTIDLVNGKGNCSVPDLAPGKYNLDIVYEGSDDYFKAFNNATFEIQKQNVDLDISIPEIKVSQKGSIIVSLAPKGVQGQAVLYIDGVRKKIVYLYNGNTTISLSNFAEGKYNITLEFVETAFYNPATVSGILNVTRYDSAINITADDVHVGQNATITVKVSPESLRGEATLIINGVNETVFIDDAVTNITIYDLPAGQYNVTLIFDGDLRYYPVITSTSFKVLRAPTVLDVKVIQDEKNLNGTITVKTNNVKCTGLVGVYVNYNLYRLNLTNGQAKFSVKYDKGTNYIFVFYNGDRYFEDATWNTTIGVADEFVFIGENSTGFEGNDFNYSVRLIEINGIPMPNRVVGVDLNGMKYNITTNQYGYAYLNLNMAAGRYNISATYKNATINNILTVRSVDFNLTSINITYGENEIIKAVFDEGVGGSVNFISEGLNVFVDIVNGTAVYMASSFDVGNYNLKAIYTNDFAYLTKNTEFHVEKANLTLDVSVLEATPYIDEIVKVSNLKNAIGDIIFIFNETEYNVPIIESQSVLNLSKLHEGNYSIVIRYLGDENYWWASRTVNFYVKQFASDLILTANDGVYGKYVTVTAKLNDDATGIVRFRTGNMTQNVNVVGGKAIWNFTGLNVGSHNITADYLGNAYYIASSNETSVIISKANSTIELYVKEVSLGENIRIYANVSPNATGSLSFSMIGYFSPRNKPIVDSKSSWYIAPLNTGEYTVIAKYAGDSNYHASNTTFILKVSQKKSVLNAEIDDAGLNDQVICSVSLKTKDGEAITGVVTLKIGSSSYRIYVMGGSGSLVIGKMASGSYSYTAEFTGNENFSSTSCSGNFKVVEDLLNVNLTANNLTKYYGGSARLQINLKDSKNNPFSNQMIIVKLNSKVYTLTTDSKGQAFLDVNFKPGNYTALISFDGTVRYHAASTNASIVVLTTVEGRDVVKVYGSSTQYFAILTDSEGNALANTDVTFKIGTKSYTVKTLPNGVARFNININPGVYTIVAKNPVTGESTSNTIRVFAYIMGNKNLVKYFGSAKSYKVRIYDDNGNPVGAGKIVKFRINGKTYSVKTDKKGYATFKINLSPKTYTITAIYNKFKVTNKVIIKPVLIVRKITSPKPNLIKITAKLLNSNGKPFKGKKVTFKFKGKTYWAKTNSKGLAAANIKAILKVGKYKITSIYGKSKVTTTINVKK